MRSPAHEPHRLSLRRPSAHKGAGGALFGFSEGALSRRVHARIPREQGVSGRLPPRSGGGGLRLEPERQVPPAQGRSHAGDRRERGYHPPPSHPPRRVDAQGDRRRDRHRDLGGRRHRRSERARTRRIRRNFALFRGHPRHGAQLEARERGLHPLRRRERRFGGERRPPYQAPRGHARRRALFRARCGGARRSRRRHGRDHGGRVPPRRSARARHHRPSARQ